MNAAINIPPADPHEELNGACTRRDGARESLKAAQADMERKVVLETEYCQCADEAARAIETNMDVQRAERLVNDHHVAVARHRAAANMAKKATVEREARAADFKAAERAVQSAARAVVIAETRGVTQPEFFSKFDELVPLYDRLIAVYTVIPEALTPQEALALEQMGQRLQTFTALGMRSPEWDIPISSPLVREGAAQQAEKVARERIDTQCKALIAEIAELTR